MTPQHSYALDLVATITRLQASLPTKLAVRCPLGAEPRDRDQHLQAGAMRHDADQAGRWVVRGAGRDDGAGGSARRCFGMIIFCGDGEIRQRDKCIAKVSLGDE